MARHTRDFGSDHARDLADDLAIARRRARNLARARNLDRNLGRDLALDHAHALGRDLTLARDRALNHARDLDLTRALNDALNHASALALFLSSDGTLASNNAHARALILADQLEKCCARARVIVRRLGEPRDVAGGGVVGERMPWGVAVRVTGWLVRVLPVGDRVMYREVYESELFDLAQTARPRRAQFAYAVRSTVGVVSLRRALRTPAPQPRRQSW